MNALSRLDYYRKRIAEAPLRVIAQKLWLRAKPRLLQPLYVYERRAAPPAVMAAQPHRAAAELGQSLRLIIAGRLQADTAFASRARARAQSVLDGNFQCLGYGAAPIPRSVGWWGDVFHAHRWNGRYFSGVDFLAVNSRSDVKVPWEFSRLQYTLWLAEGALADAGRTSVYVARFLEIVNDWMGCNPAGYGPNWTCAMEVGIRATNLLIAFTVFEPELPATDCARIIGFGPAAVQVANRQGWTDHRDPPGSHPLFHDHPRGRAACCASRHIGRHRQRVSSRYGRANPHSGTGAPAA